jgi:hypothetical protein
LPGRRSAVKARAERDLRAALTGSGPLGAALRTCCYRNPMFFVGLFHEAVVEWFGVGCDVREVTAFVARVRAARGPEAGGFPSREAEAYIRAMLGDGLMSEQLDPYAVSFPEITIAVLGRLLAEWQPGGEEVAALLDRAGVFAAERASGDGQEVVQRGQEQFGGAGVGGGPAPSCVLARRS